MDMEKFTAIRIFIFLSFLEIIRKILFFMFYIIKSKKIIIGFNNNGKIDGIVKYFKDKIEPKLFLVKNGRKIKEIDNEEKINDFLNEQNNFDSKKSFEIDKSFNKYFS